MPMVSCPQCSAGLMVPDGMAGRKARCKRCENVFQIPGETAFTARVTPVVAPVPPPAAPRRNGRGGAAETPPPTPARSRPTRRPRDEDDDNGEDEDEDRPRRRRRTRKQGAPVLFWSLVGGGSALAFGLLALFVWLLWPATPEGVAADRELLPDNPDLIVALRLRELVESPVFVRLENQAGGNNNLVAFGGDAGLDAAKARKVESLLLAEATVGTRKHRVAVARTNVNYTPETWLQELTKPSQGTLKVDGKTVYRVGDQSFCLLTSRQVLFGTEEALQTVLQRKAPPVLPVTVKRALDELDLNRTVAGVVNTVKLGGAGAVPAFPGAALPSTPDTVSFELTCGADVAATVRAQFGNADLAAGFKAQADNSLALLRNLPNAGEAQNLLNTLQLQVQGPVVVADFRVSGDALAANVGANPMVALLGKVGNNGPNNGGAVNPPPANVPPPAANNGPIDKVGSSVWVVDVKANETLTYNLHCNQADADASVWVVNFGNVHLQATLRDPNGKQVNPDTTVGPSKRYNWKVTPSGVYRLTLANLEANKTGNVHVHLNTGSPPPLANGNQPVAVAPPAVTKPGNNVGRAVLDTNNVLPFGQEQYYSVPLQAGRSYLFDMPGSFDTYLVLHNPAGQEVARDDDGGEGLNARLFYTAPQSGNYRITCRAFGGGGGAYRLTVRQSP